MLPELGKISRKQIASLCGVAPHPIQRVVRRLGIAVPTEEEEI